MVASIQDPLRAVARGSRVGNVHRLRTMQQVGSDPVEHRRTGGYHPGRDLRVEIMGYRSEVIKTGRDLWVAEVKDGIL